VDASVVWTVVGVLVVVAVVVAVVLQRRRYKADLEQLTPAQRSRHEEIVQADKVVKAAQAAYDRGVRAAQKQVEAAVKVEPLARLDATTKVVVTPLEIRFGKNVYELTEDVTVELYRDGEKTALATSRSTLTRMAAGTVLLGGQGAVAGAVAKKNKVEKVDLRELYLLASGPGWGESVKLDPTRMDQALDLIQKVKGAVSNITAFKAARQERIAAAEQLLKQAQQDTAAVEQARTARAALGPDPLAELRAARSANRKELPGPGQD